jgi:hypothetical protein
MACGYGPDTIKGCPLKWLSARTGQDDIHVAALKTAIEAHDNPCRTVRRATMQGTNQFRTLRSKRAALRANRSLAGGLACPALHLGEDTTCTAHIQGHRNGSSLGHVFVCSNGNTGRLLKPGDVNCLVEQAGRGRQAGIETETRRDGYQYNGYQYNARFHQFLHTATNGRCNIDSNKPFSPGVAIPDRRGSPRQCSGSLAQMPRSDVAPLFRHRESPNIHPSTRPDVLPVSSLPYQARKQLLACRGFALRHVFLIRDIRSTGCMHMP